MVHGCVKSDVPFGSFDIPVAISDGSGEVSALVDVDDGQGEFHVPGRSGDISVTLDPKRQLVLYARDTKEKTSMEQLSCSTDE